MKQGLRTLEYEERENIVRLLMNRVWIYEQDSIAIGFTIPESIPSLCNAHMVDCVLGGLTVERMGTYTSARKEA